MSKPENYSFKKELPKLKRLAERAGWTYDDSSKTYRHNSNPRQYVLITQLITKEELDK